MAATQREACLSTVGSLAGGQVDVPAHSMSTLSIMTTDVHEVHHSAALKFKADKSSPSVWLACQ